jgi:hypothetical protein
VLLTRFEIMTFAVNLDDKARRVTGKIGDESSHRNLAAKA